MDLYEQIKAVAKEHGYSINRLEKELGFARSSMAKFKTSVPSIEKIKAIADYLEVPVGALTGETKEDEITVTASSTNEKDLILHFRNADLTEDQKSALAKMLCSNIDTFLEYANSKKENK